MARHKKRNTNNANASNTGRRRAPGVRSSDAPSTQQPQPQQQRAADAPPHENGQARSSSFVGQALLDALEGIDADRSTSGAATPAQELACESTPAPVSEEPSMPQHQYATPDMQQQFAEWMPAAPAHNGYGYGFDPNAANAWMAAANAAAWPVMNNNNGQALPLQDWHQSFWSQMLGGGMDANAQQSGFYNQQFGQAQGGAWGQYQQQQQQQQQAAPYGLGYGIGNAWSALGNTQAFAPTAPSTMSVPSSQKQSRTWRVDKQYRVQSRGYATRAATRTAARGAGLPTPDHTTRSESEDGGVRFASWMGRGKQKGKKKKKKSPEVSSTPVYPASMFRLPASEIPPPHMPSPSTKYLSQAHGESSLRTTPEQLLIVIDLNGTLVHRPNHRDSAKVVCRPYAKAFLRYLIANHRVMVWSSARPENVAKMCAQLFRPKHREKVVAEWGRDRLGLTAAQYHEKVQVYKQLKKVWDAAAWKSWHPRHEEGERYGQHNTLLIDDSQLKAASEPHNLVQVEEFEAKPRQMLVDVLGEVKGYLQEAMWQTDVSAWIHAGNGFVVGRWKGEWEKGVVDGVDVRRKRAAVDALKKEEEKEEERKEKEERKRKEKEEKKEEEVVVEEEEGKGVVG